VDENNQVPEPGSLLLAGLALGALALWRTARRALNPTTCPTRPDRHGLTRPTRLPPAKEFPMAEPFIGEIKIFAGDFAPRGWAMCAGQLLPIASNQALFAILGTTYGGDGRVNFGLPDLRGRAPRALGAGARVCRPSRSASAPVPRA
jgi:hypothetical protein